VTGSWQYPTRKQYETVNYTSWTENCEESAIGRALDNAGYASSPSREEMQKVERASAAQSGDPLADGPSEHLVRRVKELVQKAHDEDKLLSGIELVKALEMIDRQKTDGSLAALENSFKERLEEKRGKLDEQADTPAEEELF
jgi:hypothetical protein